MRRYLFLLGAALITAGIFIFLYASGRNCIIALLTRGWLTFWTAIEVMGGTIVITGLFIAVFGIIKNLEGGFIAVASEFKYLLTVCEVDRRKVAQRARRKSGKIIVDTLTKFETQRETHSEASCER
jgi:hypothetical protein